jgi:hypothetical protein
LSGLKIKVSQADFIERGIEEEPERTFEIAVASAAVVDSEFFSNALSSFTDIPSSAEALFGIFLIVSKTHWGETGSLNSISELGDQDDVALSSSFISVGISGKSLLDLN